MKRINWQKIGVFAALLAFWSACAAYACAQDFGASIHGQVFGVTNNPNTVADNVGLGFGGRFNYKRYTLGGDVFGDFQQAGGQAPTRSQYHGAARVFQYEKWSFHVGGGAAKTGNELYGFGRLVAEHPTGLYLSGNYGSDNFTDAFVSFPIFRSNHFRIAPVYNFRNEKIKGLGTQTHRVGLQFTVIR